MKFLAPGGRPALSLKKLIAPVVAPTASTTSFLNGERVPKDPETALLISGDLTFYKGL
jgi:hypothetical protein